MSGGSSEIHQVPSRAQIKCLGDVRRGNLAKAMHTAQKHTLRVFGAEEVLKQRLPGTKGLFPPVRPFPNRVFEVCPQRIQRPVRIDDIADQVAWTAGNQVRVADSSVRAS